MADLGSYGVAGPRLDLEQLQLEAQHRWLRPAEICEILSNYKSFIITKEPPNRPPSGSLFLFDRKVLRYFRKDGYNWRKKKDGKTVKEAHEKLKVGSVDVLHCYYAHGEDSESFQRRSYWMLEPDMMHIVFVHYLEVKGNRIHVGANRAIDESASVSRNGSSIVSSAVPSGSTDSMSPTITSTSLCEDADSGYIHQLGSTVNSIRVSPHLGNGLMDKRDPGLLKSYLVHPFPDHFIKVQGNKSRASHGSSTIASQITNDLTPWDKVIEQCPVEFHNDPSLAPSSSQPISMGNILGEENYVVVDYIDDKNALAEEGTSSQPIQSSWQIPEETQRNVPKWSISQLLSSELVPDFNMDVFEQRLVDGSLELSPLLFNVPGHSNDPPGEEKSAAVLENSHLKYSENLIPGEENIGYVLNVKRTLLDAEESLKKVDSFSRWISRELGEVDDLQMQSSSGISWTADCRNIIDHSSLSPSLSQDQLFSITDFWPKWSSADSETEVIVTGNFLKSRQDIANCKWSCMFGEMEVPAEVLADGVLSCFAPAHKEGRVPFYMTRSNRLACSEVREFDYQEGSSNILEIEDVYGNSARDMMLHFRFERLLSQKSGRLSNYVCEDNAAKRSIIGKLISLKKEEFFSQNEELAPEMDLFHRRVQELILQNQLKEKLYAWLINRVSEDGKGPCVLDRDGQGVLHLVAALGYDWAIAPIIKVGVSINFRDVNGWTALHWAASSGRENTVALLVSLGAAPGLLTDPSPEHKLGRTPADLASGNGHKGISGLLAEFSLVSHLSSLAVDDCGEDASRGVTALKAVQTISERMPTPGIYGDVADELSLKDSLTAVLNATQAADRIHQVYRMQSFQRKRLTEFENDELGLLDQYAVSFLASREGRAGQGDRLAHAAATHIQKKFRGWKKRKEFLIIRQRIVKIQAHVRGHQVRKKYKSIIWSVGILEKVILRWRRKGSGLRGFRPEAVNKDQNQPPPLPSREDDYDFLNEGRKQTEERLQKALSRVKSMVQYPEARAQYRRLLTVVEGFRENKGGDMDLINSEETVDGVQDMIDIDLLLDDDHFMPLAFN